MKVELILSIVLAVATVLYTVINFMMWMESRATRRQKIAPLMIAYLKGSEDHKVLCLHFKNIGEGCANNVSIKVIKDYNQFGKENHPLSSVSFVKNGANIFPPQYDLVYFIDYFSDIDSTKEDNYVEFEITYFDIKGKVFIDIYKLPFNQIACNYTTPPETHIGKIAYYLKSINETIKKQKT